MSKIIKFDFNAERERNEAFEYMQNHPIFHMHMDYIKSNGVTDPNESFDKLMEDFRVWEQKDTTSPRYKVILNCVHDFVGAQTMKAV